jgi:acyl carrier protein
VLTSAAVRAQVVGVVATATLLPAEEVDAADWLFDLPGFDSLAVVEILARLESAFGVEVPAEAVLPEVFGRVSALAELVSAALASRDRVTAGEAG